MTNLFAFNNCFSISLLVLGTHSSGPFKVAVSVTLTVYNFAFELGSINVDHMTFASLFVEVPITCVTAFTVGVDLYAKAVPLLDKQLTQLLRNLFAILHDPWLSSFFFKLLLCLFTRIILVHRGFTRLLLL